MQTALDGLMSEQDTVLAKVQADKATTFSAGFYHWLRDNWDIWKRFQIETDKLRARGLRHYSARTIVEYLRHETALREGEGAIFKINNNAAPDMARLYREMTGCTTFFEMRERPLPVQMVADLPTR